MASTEDTHHLSGEYLFLPLVFSMLPTSSVTFVALRETVQHVLLTQTEVEALKAIHHETNHTGKRQAWICRDRLHGSADRAEVT
jgi:hypothetical protein